MFHIVMNGEGESCTGINVDPDVDCHLDPLTPSVYLQIRGPLLLNLSPGPESKAFKTRISHEIMLSTRKIKERHG